ncbi:MAG TPA: hypothetical protein PK693_08305 [Halothiobacillus sp.]|nr:hypothetical protein [Halothiobacillus sp.]
MQPNKSKVRRLLNWLERAKLIERIEDENGYLVYFLPFAKKDYQPGQYTSFNSGEDELLQGMPEPAQLLYLRGLRRYMDYASAIVGGSARRISLLMFSELVEVFPHQGMKGIRYDKHKIRRLLGWLERSGLIEPIEDKNGYLVYFLPFAKNEYYSDTHSSGQKKPNVIDNESSGNKEPYSDAGLSLINIPSKNRYSRKAATHQESNINNQKTTTTTTEESNDMADDSADGGGEVNPVASDQSPQQARRVSKSASWEEKLIYPDGLREGDKKAIICHLKHCPAEQRQAVIDELAARQQGVKSPSGYVRKLVDCVLHGEFVPEAGIPLAEARERHKNDFQMVSPTRRPEPTDSVKAEIARLTAEMVAAQQSGDFKRYSKLGAQVGRLG